MTARKPSAAAMAFASDWEARRDHGMQAVNEENLAGFLDAFARLAAARMKERCARIVETQYRRDIDGIDQNYDRESAKSRHAHRCAAAIRALPVEEER